MVSVVDLQLVLWTCFVERHSQQYFKPKLPNQHIYLSLGCPLSDGDLFGSMPGKVRLRLMSTKAVRELCLLLLQLCPGCIKGSSRLAGIWITLLRLEVIGKKKRVDRRKVRREEKKSREEYFT
ncbi:hypothetical protein AVEN_161468-1 [Araneus ventricosus]|uniref:Uncharacterized protein n=1 Tax=Araneus ventricosus TaxID=182803 RepID=A0A4Y2M936_ARAVE|nr:hypothetical protein AVEN_161468-1 [Araneus ventricosus]